MRIQTVLALVLTALALVVAAMALVTARLALRSADRANRSADRAILVANRADAQLAKATTELARLERRANALDDLCWSSRHAALPSSSAIAEADPTAEYAANVGIAIVHSIAQACDDAAVPDRVPRSR